MERANWTEQDLIDRLYGISNTPPEVLAQWEATPEYRAAWERVQARRASGRPAPEPDFAAQRREIYARLERPQVAWGRWLSAGLATAALAGVLLVNRPVAVGTAPDEISDAQLFQEIATIEQTAEPRAAATVKELFHSN